MGDSEEPRIEPLVHRRKLKLHGSHGCIDVPELDWPSFRILETELRLVGLGIATEITLGIRPHNHDDGWLRFSKIVSQMLVRVCRETPELRDRLWRIEHQEIHTLGKARRWSASRRVDDPIKDSTGRSFLSVLPHAPASANNRIEFHPATVGTLRSITRCDVSKNRPHLPEIVDPSD